LKYIGSIFLGAVVLFFISVTNSRFSEAYVYLELMPDTSIVKDPVLYSLLDYFSQWYHQGFYVLDRYQYITFNGQSSLSQVLLFVNGLTPFTWSMEEFLLLKQKILGSDLYDKFTGLVPNLVFDMGYIFTVIFAAVFNRLASYFAPKKGEIGLMSAFLMVLLIQLPMFAIFYSSLGVIVICFIFLICIGIYLKF
jgi:hypothetical protein